MTWLAEHWKDVLVVLWLLDQITAMTPKTWKPFGIPVGQYDNVIVSLAKQALRKILNK